VRRIGQGVLVCAIGALLGLIAPLVVVDRPAGALIAVSSALGALILTALWRSIRL
jgi:hypothetical protein